MKMTLCALGALMMLALPMRVQAQQRNANEMATSVPGVRTFVAPPAGFDAIIASDEELAGFGFPPRPDPAAARKQYASWARAMRASRTRILPSVEQTKILHGPLRIRQAGEANDSTSLESYNWSGYVNLIGATRFGTTSFYTIAAELVVPTANQAFGTCSGTADYASSWVGMDGDNSSDVLQAGVEFDVECYKGATSTLYAPWFEWYPASEFRITNLPIAPGDDFFIEVWNTSSTQGYAYLVNENANEAATLSLTPPAGTKLVGNSAEWITERPNVNGASATLTNYIAEPFWSGAGISHSGRVFDPGSSDSITMFDDNNVEISYPTLLGDNAFLVQDVNTAR
jgi:hypothetical protein